MARISITVPLPAGVGVEANIAYAEYPETKLDVFKPAGWSSSAKPKYPGILVIHGGGWTGGTKESMLERWVLPYVEKGFVAVNVEYRLAKAAPAPAAVEDVLKAAQWFEKNAGRLNVDKDRIAVTGGSAGGHNGLKSIEGAVGSQEYARLRIGVGPEDPSRRGDLADYVLSDFGKRDEKVVRELFPTLTELVETWIAEGAHKAMNRFNRIGKPGREEV